MSSENDLFVIGSSFTCLRIWSWLRGVVCVVRSGGVGWFNGGVRWLRQCCLG